jgi:hypothetical protein
MAISNDILSAETDARFAAQTGFRPGQRLDPNNPTDRAMMPVWRDIYNKVKSEAAAGTLVTTFDHPHVQQSLLDAAVANKAAGIHAALAAAATDAETAQSNVAAAAIAHQISTQRAQEAASVQPPTVSPSLVAVASKDVANNPPPPPQAPADEHIAHQHVRHGGAHRHAQEVHEQAQAKTASHEALYAETDKRFWAQTNYKPGQRLDMSIPEDAEKAKIWMQIFNQVQSEAAAGTLVLTDVSPPPAAPQSPAGEPPPPPPPTTPPPQAPLPQAAPPPPPQPTLPIVPAAYSPPGYPPPYALPYPPSMMQPRPPYRSPGYPPPMTQPRPPYMPPGMYGPPMGPMRQMQPPSMQQPPYPMQPHPMQQPQQPGMGPSPEHREHREHHKRRHPRDQGPQPGQPGGQPGPQQFMAAQAAPGEQVPSNGVPAGTDSGPSDGGMTPTPDSTRANGGSGPVEGAAAPSSGMSFGTVALIGLGVATVGALVYTGMKGSKSSAPSRSRSRAAAAFDGGPELPSRAPRLPRAARS